MRDAMKDKLAKPKRVASKCGSVSDGLVPIVAIDFRDRPAMANQYTRRPLDVIPTGAAFQAERGISRATKSKGRRSLNRLKCLFEILRMNLPKSKLTEYQRSLNLSCSSSRL